MMPRVIASRLARPGGPVSTTRDPEALPPSGYAFTLSGSWVACVSLTRAKECVLCHMARPARVRHTAGLLRWWHRRVTWLLGVAVLAATVGLAGGWIIAVEVEANELAKFVGLHQLIDCPVCSCL